MTTGGPTEEEVARIWLRPHTGRLLGGHAFLGKLETFLGGRGHPLSVGGPRKRRTRGITA